VVDPKHQFGGSPVVNLQDLRNERLAAARAAPPGQQANARIYFLVALHSAGAIAAIALGSESTE